MCAQVAHEFAPDLVIVAAGFDAAEGDPIGKVCPRRALNGRSPSHQF